jgi:SAM-dependent methyltransferase
VSGQAGDAGRATPVDNDAVPGEEWTADEDRVSAYLERADEFPHRAEGEGVLLDHVHHGVRRVLDLGTGDGRLLAMVLADRLEAVGAGLDFSELMLAAAPALRRRGAGLARRARPQPAAALAREL